MHILVENDKAPCSVYNHLVITLKFNMPPVSYIVKGCFTGYELKPKVKEIIDEAYYAVVLLDKVVL